MSVPHRVTFDANLSIAAGDDHALASPGPITLEGLAVPWEQTVPLNSWGDQVEFAAGSLVPTDPGRVPLLLDHGRHAMGYGLSFEDRPEGLWARFAIPRDELDDPDTARAVRQMSNGVRTALSIGATLGTPDESPGDDRGTTRYRVTAESGARLLEVSSVLMPRFDDARHQPIAAGHDTEDTMPDTTTLPTVAVAQAADVDEAVRLEAHRAATVTLGRAAHPLARFATFGEYAMARRRDPDIPTLQAAWVDQITSNNAGVVPPAWLTEVFGIVESGRPFITALGGPRSLPDSGMEVDWPYFDGTLSALVGVQGTEKTEITSVRVDLKKGSASVVTYAGGSDVSLQLLERSSPSYRDAYFRIMAQAYALVTDDAACDAALTAATGTGALDLATGDADDVAACLFEASVDVQAATGSPATVVAVASNLYKLIGPLILQLAASANNAAGASASAAPLEVALAGLRVVHVPTMADDTMLVTNRAACAWFEDGPRTLDEVAVSKLGRDLAVYGFGAFGDFIPAGIVEVTVTLGT